MRFSSASLRYLLSAVALVGLSAASAPRGDVLIVDQNDGPGTDYTYLYGALEAAALGDTLLLRSNEVPFTTPDGFSFRVNKTLTIAAEEGATVKLGNYIRVEFLAPGDRVVLRGLTFVDQPFSLDFTAVVLRQNEGSVWIEDCDFPALGTGNFTILESRWGAGLTATDSVDVVIARSTFRGNPTGTFDQLTSPGIDAVNSTIHVYDSLIVGGFREPDEGSQTGSGAAGVRLHDSTFFASGTSIQGGEGQPAQIFFCGSNGGEGLLLESGANVATLLDCTLAGGAPGTDPCPDSVVGAESLVLSGTLAEPSGTARSFETSGPVAAGGSIDLTFTGEPGDLTFLLALSTVQTVPVPGAVGPLLGVPSVLVNLGPLPPSGELALSAPGVDVPFGTSLTVTVQSLFLGVSEAVFGPGSAATFFNL